jgi:hypothetical protein
LRTILLTLPALLISASPRTGHADEPPAAPPAEATTPAPTPAPEEMARPPESSSYPRLRRGAWAGLTFTIALAAAGVTCGLLSQARSDDVGNTESAADPTKGKLVHYDASAEKHLSDLRSEGILYEQAAISLFAAAGATAIVTRILFFVAQRRQMEVPKVSLLPTPDRQGASLSAQWSF